MFRSAIACMLASCRPALSVPSNRSPGLSGASRGPAADGRKAIPLKALGPDPLLFSARPSADGRVLVIAAVVFLKDQVNTKFNNSGSSLSSAGS